MNEDYNDGENWGVACAQTNTRRGMRWSAARAYLHPVLKRPNLTVLTNAVVGRVPVENNRTTGVTYHRANVASESENAAYAQREIVLSAGALHSPHLLELSGIGDGQRLRELGVPVVRHLPSVGENLRDHLHVPVAFESRRPDTVNDLLRSRWHAARALIRYVLLRRGLFATANFKTIEYVRSGPECAVPDIRLHCALVSGPSRDPGEGVDPFSGFHLGGYSLYPESTGSVHAISTNPRKDPRITANDLQQREDLTTTLSAIHTMRAIASEPGLRAVIVREVRPGPETADDPELTNYVRRKGETAWHPVGTCRMGSRSDAVVAPHLRVHGIEGLRIADRSVTPFHVSSNTHVPAILMGEKAADLILTGRWLAKKRLTNISERSSNCTRTLTAPAVTST